MVIVLACFLLHIHNLLHITHNPKILWLKKTLHLPMILWVSNLIWV